MVIPENSHFHQQWHLRLINAPEAWQVLNGGLIPIQGCLNQLKS